jgi:hypothetical protein
VLEINAEHFLPILSLSNNKTEFLKVSFFNSALISAHSGFVDLLSKRAITGSNANLTFAGGFAKFFSSLMLINN